MIEKIGNYFAGWAKKYIPDPMIFAIILTILTYILGIILTKNTPFKMVLYWYKGFWILLKFAMQMSIVLVTGYALATTPVVQKFLKWLANIPKTSVGATYMVAFVASVAGFINWGLGLIVGAIFALEVGRQSYKNNKKFHYPLLVAAGYAGLAVWHGGLSGSAPLLVATKGNFMEKAIGKIIPVSQTIGSTLNIAMIVILLIFVPLILALMTPKKEEKIVVIPENIREPSKISEKPKSEWTFADKLENSIILSMTIAAGGLVYIIYYFATHGFALNLNIVNFTFLIVGIILHKRPMEYVNAVSDGIRGTAGIVLQFPFYAGIMGMMKFSGLVAIIAGWFVSISTPTTFPVLSYISAAIVNLFVPSGGGQWAVQGPVLVEAAKTLHVPISKTIMAFAYGDEWTNLFQPFWALPLLGICGVRARDIMGYAMALMLIGIPVFIVALLIL